MHTSRTAAPQLHRDAVTLDGIARPDSSEILTRSPIAGLARNRAPQATRPFSRERTRRVNAPEAVTFWALPSNWRVARRPELVHPALGFT